MMNMENKKKLSLNELSKNELNKRQMKSLKGGDFCNQHCGTKKPVDKDVTGTWKAAYGED